MELEELTSGSLFDLGSNLTSNIDEIKARDDQAHHRWDLERLTSLTHSVSELSARLAEFEEGDGLVVECRKNLLDCLTALTKAKASQTSSARQRVNIHRPALPT